MVKQVYNKNGLQIRFSDTLGEDINSGMYVTDVNEIAYELDFFPADLHADETNVLTFAFKPKKGSTLKNACLIVAEPVVGGTSFDIGLKDTEGENEIDLDGFFSGVTTAEVATKGAEIHGTGALIGTDITDNGVFTVTTVGEFTAGRIRARLIFEVL